jgi:hypothetical protein
MWWTPTRGLLRAAARDFAAFEPTLRQPPIPTGINREGILSENYEITTYLDLA